MPLTSQEVGLAGVAIAALGYISKGLIDLLSKRMLEPIHAGLTESQVRKISKDGSAPILAELTEMSALMSELIRMHRDPNSIFATGDVGRTLNEVHRIVSILEQRRTGP